MSNILKNYLEKIKTITTKDKEHTHRTALQLLLESLADNYSNTKSKIHIIHEPNNDKEGRGAPDFLVTQHSLTLGYIENKRLDSNLDEIAQSEQILKYTKLSPNIVLTDYLNFCLIRLDEKHNPYIIKHFRICSSDEIAKILKYEEILREREEQLLEIFSIFFSYAPTSITTAKDFSDRLSLRAKLLKDELLSLPTDQTVASLFNTFRDVLYKELSFQDFCDSFAQSLTYSLFLAKLNNAKNTPINLYNAKSFIPKSFPLIRAMSGFLDQLEDLDGVKWLIEEIIAIINHIDIQTIVRQLNKISEKNLFGEYIHKDPYLHFYETFLTSYDPKLRELRGVYYTPAPVVDFIINSIDLILKKTFSQKEGLSSALTNEKITLLDFATGTGTFLLEAFRKALNPISKNSPKYAPKNLLPRFCGFEFLTAPYTIAHLKLSQTFKEEFSSPLEDHERLNITLTNTLYNLKTSYEKNSKSHLFVGMIQLEDEYQKAQSIKEQEILIITGNPPYSGASGNKGLFEYEVRTSYGLEPSMQTLDESQAKELQSNITQYYRLRDEPEYQLNTDFKKAVKFLDGLIKARKLQNEKNPKWLLDDYVKFIRFAESKIASQDSGIFAFISNNGFLDNPTFRGMRYALMQTFDTMYVLDLHGNARKKEKAPNGSKDDNVFDIMQGVSINIFIKSPKKSKAPQIFHYDLFGKRKDKYQFLLENSLESIPWTSLTPQEPHYLFIPQDENLRKRYDQGVSVKDIFNLNGVGICSKRDHIVFHNTKEEILQLLNDFSTKPKEELYHLYNIGEDSRDWKLDSAITSIQKNLRDFTPYIRQCNYRPFDTRWTYYISESRAFMAYPVYDIFEHFLDKENIGLMIGRQFGAVGSDEFDIVFCTDKIVDLNFYRRGGEQVFPLYLYPTERSKKKEQTLFDIGGGGGCESKMENFAPDFRKKIDSLYQEHFSPEVILGYIYAILFHRVYREKYIDFLKIDFPKIPFVKDKEIFLSLSSLGSKLIALHLLKSDELDSSVGEPLYADVKNPIIEQSKYIHGDIFVNSSLHFKNVDPKVWEYKIGGYQVLDKYLKSHKGEKIDYEHFQKIIAILYKSLETEEQISRIDIGV